MTSAQPLKCGRPSVLNRTASTTARLHLCGLQQRPRSLSLPGESAEFQFSGENDYIYSFGDLAGKQEFGGLAGEGK
ncbi:hypothetical protein ACLB2K_046930 [Fragaria x ananassa]